MRYIVEGELNTPLGRRPRADGRLAERRPGGRRCWHHSSHPRGGAAYEVEFMTFAGKTIAVATVEASDVRPVGERDVSHVRELQSA